MTKDELLKQLGRNVKAERVRKGYSQDTFAELLNVTRSHISKIECGGENMSIAKILEVARALNIHISGLLRFD